MHCTSLSRIFDLIILKKNILKNAIFKSTNLSFEKSNLNFVVFFTAILLYFFLSS